MRKLICRIKAYLRSIVEYVREIDEYLEECRKGADKND